MARYSLRILHSAITDLGELATNAERMAVVECIHSLADDPQPKSSQKLSGREYYRIRQGKCSIVYAIDDQALTVHLIKAGVQIPSGIPAPQ